MMIRCRGLLRRDGRRGGRRRQFGGHTVEATLVLIPFFIVVFLTIDICILMFDQAALNHAARYGARQGTLYWVDPNDYDETDPLGNVRIKEAMMDSAVDHYIDATLINPSGASVAPTIELTGATASGAAPNRLWTGVADASASVQLTYPHSFFAVSRLLSVTDWALGATTALGTEMN